MALLQNLRVRAIAAAVLAMVASIGIWLWVTAGRESTDDAQIDAHVTQIAARVGGTVQAVYVDDNRWVDAGTTLVEIDPRDYQVAVEKARAALADAEAAAAAAQSGVPITTQSATSNLTSARGSVEQATSAVASAQKQVEAAHARVASTGCEACWPRMKSPSSSSIRRRRRLTPRVPRPIQPGHRSPKPRRASW